jgi:tetratricopeptide (TPR) repeat protein
VALSEQITPYINAAVRAYGARVLDAHTDTQADAPTEFGRRLLAEIYAVLSEKGQLPEAVERLIADPEDSEAREALESEVQRTLFDDPWIETVVSDMLVSFYQQEIATGNSDAMVGLGDLLRWQGNPEGAQAAYEQAIDSGNAHAMIDLAQLQRGDLGDIEASRATFERAIDSGNAEVALEAMLELGHLLLLSQIDIERARFAFERVIVSRHPEWAPIAMVGLGRLLQRQGDIAGARVSYQQAIESGHADSAERASAFLNRMKQ